MQRQITNGIAPENVSVDLCIRMKPLHAKWVTQYYDSMKVHKEIVVNGWRRSGITDALENVSQKEEPFEN